MAASRQEVEEMRQALSDRMDLMQKNIAEILDTAKQDVTQLKDAIAKEFEVPESTLNTLMRQQTLNAVNPITVRIDLIGENLQRL